MAGSLPPIGSLVAQKYRIEARLGEGGRGALYRARQLPMERPVALKWLAPSLFGAAEGVERFLREVQGAARIHHPNVVEIFDVGREDGGLYVVMELLEGESLEECLEDDSLPLLAGLSVLLDAMEGVAAAHARGVVHGDLKPANIFVARSAAEPQGVGKVLDFGLSKLARERLGDTEGPEREFDMRRDVQAFGVILYRLLTGSLPGSNVLGRRSETRSSSTLIDQAARLASRALVPPTQLRPELPAALDGIVARAVADSELGFTPHAQARDDRFPNVRAMISALRPLLSSPEFSDRLRSLGSQPDLQAARRPRAAGESIHTSLRPPPAHFHHAAKSSSGYGPLLLAAAAALVGLAGFLALGGGASREEPAIRRLVRQPDDGGSAPLREETILSLMSTPPGALVLVNDREVGRTPLKVSLESDLPELRTRFRFVRDGYEELSMARHISGARMVIDVGLEPRSSAADSELPVKITYP
jgi:serine/threonine protein kinase